jgi:large subunit ribosomal protein L24
MKIKKNDKVKILSGKDRGKSGKVLQTMPKKNRVSVEGLNILIKHLRPSREGEKGQRVEFPAFVNISNVALICPECDKPTRVGYKLIKKDNQKEKKYRFCKKCQAIIE